MTNLSLYFSAMYAHIRVNGNATNCTINKPTIIALSSKFNNFAYKTAELITVWTPSMYKKNASKNKNIFLFSEIDFIVE